MLPPLRSSSGSNSPYQNHTSLNSTSHLVTEASYKVHFTGAEGDPNSSSAGKLNVLLLAGRERMADHLAMLADAIGQAIDLPRTDGESDGDYALRLAEALKKLTPAQRADVERHLNQVVQGLRLRFLFEAFNNPTGPEAARIVAYLETARYKDRDLVAKSVVTSYRQHGDADAPDHAKPRPSADQPPRATSVTEADASGETVLHTAPETGKAGTAAKGTVPDAADGPETEEAMEQAFSENITADAETEASADAPLQQAAAADGHDAAAQAEGPDARHLQELLKKAFEGGESGDAAIEAKATAQLLADAEQDMILDIATGLEAMQEEVTEFDLDSHFAATATTKPAPRAAAEQLPGKQHVVPETRGGGVFRHEAAEAETTAGDPVHTARKLSAQPKINIFAPNPIREDDYRPTLYILKGWTEVIETDSDLAEDLAMILTPESEAADDSRNRAMPRISLASEAAGGPDDMTMAGRAIADDDDGGRTYERRAAPAITEDAAPADADATLRDTEQAAETLAARTPQQAAERQALAQLSLTGRDGIPHPLVGYPPAQDMLAFEEAEDDHRRFHDDGEQRGDEQARGEDQEPEQQAADDERTADPEAAEMDEDGAEQRAYDLYQRMAGWS